MISPAAAPSGAIANTAITLVREQLIAIILGSVFVFVALAALVVAALRRRGQVRILLWFAAFVGFFGLRMLATAKPLADLLPHNWRFGAAALVVFVNYLLLVPGILFWAELSQTGFRRVLDGFMYAALAVGVPGFLTFLSSGAPFRFMRYESIVAVATLALLAAVTVAPPLARKCLVIQSPVLAVGMLTAAAAAIYANMTTILHLPYPEFVEPPAFAIFVFSLGYVAGQKVIADERRLNSIQGELEVARGIQRSILPAALPELESLRVAFAYEPMAEVAGDFYDFVAVDPRHAGFLVADVAGHGVPAALLASMIKAGMQPAAKFADDPARVLGELNRIFAGGTREHLISAAYLWLDTENRTALYSAAGHPALLFWHGETGEVERVESNGLLLGVMPGAEFPVRRFSFAPGDRFVLYTDGLVEPENELGEAFGGGRVEQGMRALADRSADELVNGLLGAVRKWRPVQLGQHDDITLIVIDAVASS